MRKNAVVKDAKPERKVIHRNRRTQEELHAALEAQLQKQLDKAEEIRKRIESLDNARFSTNAVLSKAIPDVKRIFGEGVVVTPEFLVGMASAVCDQMQDGELQYDDLVALGEKHISRPSQELLHLVRRR